jgi:hypothetical protein
MRGDRRRLLELALESLENKKKEIDREIAEITREISARTKVSSSQKPRVSAKGRRRSQFSEKEKLRRSKRMKAYWNNWRKKSR